MGLLNYMTFIKGSIPWNKNRKMDDYSQMGFQKGHPAYSTKGRFIKGQIPWNKGAKIQSNTGRTHFKQGQNIGDKNHKWKGDSVGYLGIHSWVYRMKGNPKICEYCGKPAKHWANIDHKYRRNLNDFIAMCVSCHKKYDLKNNLSYKFNDVNK
jgi:hypothetical protein